MPFVQSRYDGAPNARSAANDPGRRTSYLRKNYDRVRERATEAGKVRALILGDLSAWPGNARNIYLRIVRCLFG